MDHSYRKYWRTVQKSRDWYFQIVLIESFALSDKAFVVSDEYLHTPQMDEFEGRPFSGKSSFGLLKTLFH